MPATLALADVRKGQVLDFDGLRKEAEDAAATYSGKQQDLADELGVTEVSLSRALNKAGSRYAALQRRVIAKLTDYVVTERRQFVVGRKADEDA